MELWNRLEALVLFRETVAIDAGCYVSFERLVAETEKKCNIFQGFQQKKKPIRRRIIAVMIRCAPLTSGSFLNIDVAVLVVITN